MVLRHVVIRCRRFQETYRLRLQGLSPKTPDDEGGRSIPKVAIRFHREAAPYLRRTQYKVNKNLRGVFHRQQVAGLAKQSVST